VLWLDSGSRILPGTLEWAYRAMNQRGGFFSPVPDNDPAATWCVQRPSVQRIMVLTRSSLFTFTHILSQKKRRFRHGLVGVKHQLIGSGSITASVRFSVVATHYFLSHFAANVLLILPVCKACGSFGCLLKACNVDGEDQMTLFHVLCVCPSVPGLLSSTFVHSEFFRELAVETKSYGCLMNTVSSFTTPT
jgi:hypothetical protein